MSVLKEGDLTDAERAAIADHPRPGAWIEGGIQWDGDAFKTEPGDGRMLSQDDTDDLIATELMADAAFGAPDTIQELAAAIGPRPRVAAVDGVHPCGQRGGIHSEPLVRLFAYRLWGERDRAWLKRDTVKALLDQIPAFGDAEVNEVFRRVYGFDRVVHRSVIGGLRIEAWRAGREASAPMNELDIAAAGSGLELLELQLDAYDSIDASFKTGQVEPPPEPFPPPPTP